MKTITLFCVGGFLFRFSLLPVQGQDKGEIYVEDVLEQLKRTDANLITGEEYLSVGQDKKMTDATGVLAAVRQLDFPKLRKMIEAETDYACVIGKDYVVIFPKDNPSQYDMAFAKRIVTFPDATNMPIRQFLAQIKSADKQNSIRMAQGMIFESQMDGDTPISMNGGQSVCYEVLNAMASNLKARSWSMDHLVNFDPKTQKPALPVKLYVGGVYFRRY